MAGHKNFNELRNRMSPESRARIDARTNELEAEMLLSQLRKHADMTQAEVAEALGIKQPTLSKLENDDDMQLSTLARIVRAVGGELEIAVKLPGGKRVRLSQFAP